MMCNGDRARAVWLLGEYLYDPTVPSDEKPAEIDRLTEWLRNARQHQEAREGEKELVEGGVSFLTDSIPGTGKKSK